jgi:hypothetical protein
MASSWSQQAVIEAPVEDVWGLLQDPVRFAEWNKDIVAITGVPTKIEKGSTFEVTSRGPIGNATTTFQVEALEEMRELKVRCQTTGYYSRWLLTEAQGDTFADVEMGLEPPTLPRQVFRLTHHKGFLRGLTDRALDGLRRAVGRQT